MNEPARFVVPPALLAQLRARRSQQRARRPERAPATKASLIETLKGLIDSPRPDVARAATSFVDGMDTLQREVEDAEDAFLLDPGMGPMTYLTSDGRASRTIGTGMARRCARPCSTRRSPRSSSVRRRRASPIS